MLTYVTRSPCGMPRRPRYLIRHVRGARGDSACAPRGLRWNAGGRSSCRLHASSIRAATCVGRDSRTTLTSESRIAVVGASERALCDEMQQRHLKRYVAIRVCEGAELPRNIRDKRSFCRWRQLGYGIEPAE